MADDNELLVAVTEMNRGAGELATEVRALRVYGKDNRRFIKILGVSLAFDVLLSIGLAYSVHRANDAQTKADRAQTKASTDTILSCQFGNASRKDQTQLWSLVLPLLARTDADQTSRIKDYIGTAFVQRDCAEVK
jgi:hypothetical protein